MVNGASITEADDDDTNELYRKRFSFFLLPFFWTSLAWATNSIEDPLYTAASEGRTVQVVTLLSNPKLNVNWADEHQRTPLYAASMNGHHEIVKILLAHPDINVNARSTFGSTAFFYAVARMEELVLLAYC